jgi:cell wall integrity and stress response component
MSEKRYVLPPIIGTAIDNWDGSNPQNRRRSGLMAIDPRMDPFSGGIYQRTDNSRESINTLHDDQDYSRKVLDPPRVLRAMNPDPLND